jgi:2'-5' RNA ligase
MTLLFLDDDNCVEELNQEFEQCMSVFYSLPITIDKLDAFTTGDGTSHIIYLTSSQVPSQILTLADDARMLADSLNANYDKRPFKPHVTLGRVSAEKVSLDQLQNVLQSIKQPAFNCILNEAEHRYFRGDKIKTWKLK